MSIKSLVKASAVSAMLMVVSAAVSAASYCSVAGSPNTDGMKLSDVTFSGNTPSFNADDCYGLLSGNDSLANINGVWGTGWTFLVKDDSSTTPAVGTGSFGGINYTLDGSTSATSGTWTLTATPAALLPVFVDFVAVLKSSTEYGLWFFDDVKIDGSDSGTWAQNVIFNSPGGPNPQPSLQNLSHLSLYARAGKDPSDPPVVIPEPGSLALVGLALLGLGVMRRRRA